MHTDVAVLSVDTLIQRLNPGTLYHYRLVASNAAGTSYGPRGWPKTRKLGTLSFTRSTNTLVSLRAHKTVTVSAAVNPAALALLTKAVRHPLTGKLSTRLRTDQLGLMSAVTLALK